MVVDPEANLLTVAGQETMQVETVPARYKSHSKVSKVSETTTNAESKRLSPSETGVVVR